MTRSTAETTTDQGLVVERRFTEAGVHPFEAVEWEIRDAVIGDPAHPAWEQRGVEFPSSWSQNATNIVAQKYFRGNLGTTERETSVKQMIGRVAGRIAEAGRAGGYFGGEEDAEAFEAELVHLLVHQMAAFNSPVWFNVGWKSPGEEQCSACFILAVDDEMRSILEWNTEEGLIFRGGSGSGINLSKIRGSMEKLSKGGSASGPVSFMRGADAWAGSIKSGGGTRRAAKMVVLDADHPDIRDFIWCKAKEEEKADALRHAGFDMSIDGDGFHSIQYQNANNSVRLTDEFIQAVADDTEWELRARTTGEAIETVRARELMHEIAEAAWRCADPGVQYDTTINDWHTTSADGPISASNPCSEFLSNDNTACNLASLNLMKFRDEDGSLRIADFEAAVDTLILAQEIVVSFSAYPTDKITANARRLRQLGLGYANLGALLMANGMPYDSDEGRALAGAVTALMTGRAYRRSAEMAAALGPYEGYEDNRESHNRVMAKHRSAAHGQLPSDEPVAAAAQEAWDDVVALGRRHGFRNAQATVLAPTGTISFLMDCDTTGIEPDFSLVKFKNLVGGGTMTIENQGVPKALANLGYASHEVDAIVAYLMEPVDKGGVFGPRGTLLGAPYLSEEHLPVFDVAVGERAISPYGHIAMMGATQPFVSGAISKTVNMPKSSTVEDIEGAYLQGHALGLKALAIYRDGSKTVQALVTDGGREDEETEEEEAVKAAAERAPRRRRMPRERQSITHKFSIGGHEGYITAGMYEDGSVGEIFLTDIGKEGSTLRGMMNSFATAISISLQYGVPLETLVRKFCYMRFEPEGMTFNPEIPFAKSMPDYIMRWLASRFLSVDLQEELGILTAEVRARKSAQDALMRGDNAGPPAAAPETANGGGNGHAGNGNGGAGAGGNGGGGTAAGKAQPPAGQAQPGTTRAAAEALTDTPPVVPARLQGLDLGPACAACGGMMQRTGSCYTCSSCGNNTGCG